MSAIIENVVYQHAENVCFLWLQRQRAVDEPHYSFADLVHLDSRVEANLDGMRVAGAAGLPFLEEMLKAKDGGACFALASLALEADDKKRLRELFDKATAEPHLLDELVSAFAWCHPKYLKKIVRTLLTSDDEMYNVVGLRTCAAHNKPLGDYLRRCLEHSSSVVRSTALHVGADIGGTEFNSLLWSLDTPDDELEKFELARAIAFSDKRDRAVGPLARIALSDSPLRSAAVDLAMQLPDVNSSKSLLKTLDSIDGRSRDVVRGFGLLGDPSAMSWLIEKTEIPELARLAGGSISMMTGVDLAMDNLETLDAPEGGKAGPNDDPANNNVAMDDDEDLPWPDPHLVREWWGSSEKLPFGKSHLNGREKVPVELEYVLMAGMQRQRNAAATALAVNSTEAIFRDTRLPTARQEAWLS